MAELARWSWPFGGVPLAHLAMSQVNTPVGQVARLAGPLLIVVLVVVIGQAISAAFDKQWRATAAAAAVVAVFVVAAVVHPRATVVDEVDVALVQGGGAQRTRASSNQQPVVLARHVEASRLIDGPVDLIIWPENVVNPGRFLTPQRARELVDDVAARTRPVCWPAGSSRSPVARARSTITRRSRRRERDRPL